MGYGRSLSRRSAGASRPIHAPACDPLVKYGRKMVGLLPTDPFRRDLGQTAAGGRLFRGAYRGLFGRPALGKLSVRRGEPDPNEDGRPLPNIRAMSSSHARLGEGDASTDRITDADINNVVTSAGSAGGIRHDFACPPTTHSGLIVRDNPAAKRPDPSSS